jgi:hypothetical protein
VLVVGSTGGSNPVALGGTGSSLAMSTPLVIQAQGDGGKVRVGGKIKGTKTEVQGSGNTTEFDGTAPGGTELEMTEGLYINDALRIFGDVTLTAGDTARSAVFGAQEYRLSLSGSFAVGDLITVRGAARADITLTVSANVGLLPRPRRRSPISPPACVRPRLRCLQTRAPARVPWSMEVAAAFALPV